MALHVLVLLLLFLLKLTVPAEQEEGGVPVMLGNKTQIRIAREVALSGFA